MIRVDRLKILDPSGHAVLDDVCLKVDAGGAMGVVGESGSGKTTLGLALLGHVRPGLRQAGGRVRVAGADPFVGGAPQRDLRRSRIAHLGQDPGRTLTPTMRVGRLVAERLAHRDLAAVSGSLEAVGLPADQEFQRRYPHQLSGGQQQRLALARALASLPDVLVLDEPTTGQDVVTQEVVLAELARQRAERGLTLVVVSHDLAIVARLVDQIAVIRQGVVVEQGGTVRVLAQPQHHHTHDLVATCPDRARLRSGPVHASSVPAQGAASLAVSGLRAVHRGHRGEPVVAADDVGFELQRGECVAVVGASGSGKTTIARCVVGLTLPESGTVRLDGKVLAPAVRGRTTEQRAQVQLVHQDPASSLNPRRSIGGAITRPLRRIRRLDRDAAAAEAIHLLELVGLDSDLADRRPHHLSGGQRQRATIARALAAQPAVLICDEVTSALDSSAQAGIVQLLGGLRRDLGVAVLFITHDLGLVSDIADRVIVLDEGHICEHGAVSRVLEHPRHPATRDLVNACPSLSTELARRSAAAQTRSGRRH